MGEPGALACIDWMIGLAEQNKAEGAKTIKVENLLAFLKAERDHLTSPKEAGLK